MPQKSAAPSDATITQKPSRSRPTSDAKPESATRSGARRVCERRLDRDQSHAAPIHRQVSTARDAARIGTRVDLAGLEGRDLGEVEDVPNVDLRPGDLDPTETVDGEVAQRMSRADHG